MSAGNTNVRHSPLELFAYQRRIVEFLKHNERAVWNWLAAARRNGSPGDELRFELLKSTYRIDRQAQPDVYAMADDAARVLGLHDPITLYQAQDPVGLNASLAYLPGEIHVVLHGPIATQLDPLELRGLFGHELTHYLLWQSWSGDMLLAADVFSALSNDSGAHPAYFASWRLLQLYNEVFCDRGAYLVTQDLHAVVSMLVKIQTGIQEIRADSYLKQADEIFAHGPEKTGGLTHPEAFIRARALRLWVNNDPGADAAIAAMIDSDLDLQQLDLLGQERVADWTRRIIDQMMAHPWFLTEPAIAHARLYFDDYSPPSHSSAASQLAAEIGIPSPSLADYFCFVLLDFVVADRDVDEPSLASALQIAEQLGIKERFMELARQELRLRKSQIEKLDDEKTEFLRLADKEASSAS